MLNIYEIPIQKNLDIEKEKDRIQTPKNSRFTKKFLHSAIFVSILIIVSLASPVFGCDYYASPTGTGSGLSQSTPFKITNFWPIAGPGKTLCLLDGTYTGSAGMIHPWEKPNLSGTSGSPITVKALNDGQVRINGGGTLVPLHLNGNDWFIIEGINFHNSVDSVVKLYQSDNNIIRRVIAWDANVNGNDAVFTTSSTMNNLFEDCAGFGKGRKILTTSQGGNFTTFRRCWARYEQNIATSPKVTMSTGYNNDHLTAENVLLTWNAPNGASNAFSLFRTGGNSDDVVHAKVLGSIGYVRANDTFQPGQLILVNKSDQVEYKDIVIYIEPGSHMTKKRWSLSSFTGGTPSNLKATRLTGIGGAPGYIHSAWATSNILEGNSLSSIYGSGESIYAGSTRGAQVCYRYEGGVLTNTPLWPWPMNQRIIDAMNAAGKQPVDVTNTIEQMFGAIPSQCKGTGGADNNPPVAPTNLRVVAN